jgi:16S rRNA (cytosine967-C5)-methyltransferase
MRLHRNLVLAVIDSLNYIYNDGLYADKVVEKTLKRDSRWGSRDRKFIAETVYDCVRWKRLYNEIAGTKEHFTQENLWKIFTVWATLKGISLPDWKQFEGTPVRRIKGKFDELQSQRVFKESIPDWLDELGVKELGNQWEKEINALNKQADVVLRANTLKTTKEKLQKLLLEDDIEAHFINGYTDALVLAERANVFRTEAFKNGLFEVQDASSQLVAEFLEAKPGMRVVDACAGAGGKALHLAALMENKGQIIALDIYANKLKELKRRAKRDGAHNIEPRHIDSTKVFKKLYDNADRVLIDAPCSGLGVLRRNPGAKWKLQPEFLTEIQKTQTEILNTYSKMVKVGGKLVYAIAEKKISPFKSGFDGFYMALLETVS